MPDQFGHDELRIPYRYKLCHLARHRFQPQELSLAYAVVATAVDEVEGTELAELNGFKALGVENSFFDLLHINVILVALQAHHHNQPVVAVIARCVVPLMSAIRTLAL